MTSDLTEMARLFFRSIPHGRFIGLEVVSADRHSLVARLPYSAEIVGNPLTGQIHGGAVTTLIDQVSGGAVICSLDEPEGVATLDLRVDHLRRAAAGEAVIAAAECYRMTRHIAFVRCVVYQQTPAEPIATSMSSFMRTSVNTTRAMPT